MGQRCYPQTQKLGEKLLAGTATWSSNCTPGWRWLLSTWLWKQLHTYRIKSTAIWWSTANLSAVKWPKKGQKRTWKSVKSFLTQEVNRAQSVFHNTLCKKLLKISVYAFPPKCCVLFFFSPPQKALEARTSTQKNTYWILGKPAH